MALLDTQVAVLANQAMNYLVSGEAPRRLGNAHPNIAPYQTFAVADGHVIIAVGNDRQFRKLCDLLGLTALDEHTRFITNADRVRNRGAPAAALSSALLQRHRDEFLAALASARVSAGPSNDLAQVFAAPPVLRSEEH